MGEDGGDLGDFAAHLGFELGDEGVGGAEGHGLVDFQVLLDVESVVELLDADVVDGEVGAGGDGADAVVDAFGDGGGGDGVDDDVGSGEMALDGFGGGEGDLLGALEGEVARHAEGDVDEVAGAGAAGAEAVDGEDAVDGGEVADEVRGATGRAAGVASVRASMVRRARVQVTRRMMRATRMAAMGSASSRAGMLPVLSGVGGGEAEEDGAGGPDVGAEVEGVGFEGFAGVLAGDAAEVAGAGEVDGDGEEEDDEGPDGEVE